MPIVGGNCSEEHAKLREMAELWDARDKLFAKTNAAWHIWSTETDWGVYHRDDVWVMTFGCPTEKTQQSELRALGRFLKQASEHIA